MCEAGSDDGMSFESCAYHILPSIFVIDTDLVIKLTCFYKCFSVYETHMLSYLNAEYFVSSSLLPKRVYKYTIQAGMFICT